MTNDSVIQKWIWGAGDGSVDALVIYVLVSGLVLGATAGICLWRSGGRARRVSIAVASLVCDVPLIQIFWALGGPIGGALGWAFGYAIFAPLGLCISMLVPQDEFRAAVWTGTIVGVQGAMLSILVGDVLWATGFAGFVGLLWACDRLLDSRWWSDCAEGWLEAHSAQIGAVNMAAYPLLVWVALHAGPSRLKALYEYVPSQLPLHAMAFATTVSFAGAMTFGVLGLAKGLPEKTRMAALYTLLPFGLWLALARLAPTSLSAWGLLTSTLFAVTCTWVAIKNAPTPTA